MLELLLELELEPELPLLPAVVLGLTIAAAPTGVVIGSYLWGSFDQLDPSLRVCNIMSRVVFKTSTLF
jgi:hypothetical protein